MIQIEVILFRLIVKVKLKDHLPKIIDLINN